MTSKDKIKTALLAMFSAPEWDKFGLAEAGAEFVALLAEAIRGEPPIKVDLTALESAPGADQLLAELKSLRTEVAELREIAATLTQVRRTTIAIADTLNTSTTPATGAAASGMPG